MSQDLIDVVRKYRVVPVITLDDAELAVPLADALLEGGLNIIEITFRTAAAAEGIRRIVERFPDMHVGAGTVLTTDQVAEAHQAGAQFALAPGYNPKIVANALQRKLPFIPGVTTASDIEGALEQGCLLQKLFPASLIGGPDLAKAFQGPYLHTGLQLIPLGGVSARNAVEYLSLPICAGIGGSWIATRDHINNKDWGAITANAKEVISMAEALEA